MATSVKTAAAKAARAANPLSLTPKDKIPVGAERKKFLENRLVNLNLPKTSLTDTTKPLNPLGITPEINSILGELAGVPSGVLVEFCGESMSGKSTVLYMMMGEANRTGDRAALLCPENSIYVKRLKSFGIDADNIDLFECYDSIRSAEKYIELLRVMVASGEYRIIGVDSITALVPESDWEKSFEETSTIGAHARLINKMMKQLLELCTETGTIVVLINQFRNAKINAMGAMGKQAGGGEAVKLFSHMRLHFKRLEQEIKDKKGSVIGNYSEVCLVKTRYSQPKLVTQFPIYYKEGKADPLISFLSNAASAYDKYIKVSRGIYSYAHPETTKVLVKSEDPYFFRDELTRIPPPPFGQSRPKNDTSESALEWIAKKLQYSPTQYSMVLAAEPSEGEEIDSISDAVDIEYVKNPSKLFADVELDENEDIATAVIEE